jgi:hypothetical protein
MVAVSNLTQLSESPYRTPPPSTAPAMLGTHSGLASGIAADEHSEAGQHGDD